MTPPVNCPFCAKRLSTRAYCREHCLQVHKKVCPLPYWPRKANVHPYARKSRAVSKNKTKPVAKNKMKPVAVLPSAIAPVFPVDPKPTPDNAENDDVILGFMVCESVLHQNGDEQTVVSDGFRNNQGHVPVWRKDAGLPCWTSLQHAQGEIHVLRQRQGSQVHQCNAGSGVRIFSAAMLTGSVQSIVLGVHVPESAAFLRHKNGRGDYRDYRPSSAESAWLQGGWVPRTILLLVM